MAADTASNRAQIQDIGRTIAAGSNKTVGWVGNVPTKVTLCRWFEDLGGTWDVTISGKNITIFRKS